MALCLHLDLDRLASQATDAKASTLIAEEGQPLQSIRRVDNGEARPRHRVPPGVDDKSVKDSGGLESKLNRGALPGRNHGTPLLGKEAVSGGYERVPSGIEPGDAKPSVGTADPIVCKPIRIRLEQGLLSYPDTRSSNRLATGAGHDTLDHTGCSQCHIDVATLNAGAKIDAH